VAQIQILRGQQFPSDIVLLASSNDDGLAYIATAELDGYVRPHAADHLVWWLRTHASRPVRCSETNLKRRQSTYTNTTIMNAAVRGPPILRQKSAPRALPPPSRAPDHPSASGLQAANALSGRIECDHPNERLYQFQGRIRFLAASPAPLNSENLLLRVRERERRVHGRRMPGLRGPRVCRPPHRAPCSATRPLSLAWSCTSAPTPRSCGARVVGCANVASGRLCRLTAYADGMGVRSNLKSTTLKFSSLEGKVNMLVLAIFILNLITLLITSLLSGNWQATVGECSSPTVCKSWYIQWGVSGAEVRPPTHPRRTQGPCRTCSAHWALCPLPGRRPPSADLLCAVLVHDSHLSLRHHRDLAPHASALHVFGQ
jgi:hypothetical protein